MTGRLGRGVHAEGGGGDRSGGGTPGKTTMTQRLAVQRKAGPVQRKAGPGHGGDGQVVIAGVTLTAHAGAAELTPLEAALRALAGGAAALDRLRKAAADGVDAVVAIFEGLGAHGGLLHAIAERYVAFVQEATHPKDEGKGKEGARGKDPKGGEDDQDAGDPGPASSLRSTLQALGYSEKKLAAFPTGEIDSGGPITSALASAAADVLAQIHREVPGVHVTVTGGNDDFHTHFGANSHSQGRALDFSISPGGEPELDAVATILHARARSFVGTPEIKSKPDAGGSKVLAYAQDEYRKPSPGSSGGHFHINV